MYVCKYHCLLHSINCVICTYSTYCAYCNTYVRMYITLYCFVRDEWANDIVEAHCYEFKSSEVMSIHSARVQKNCSGMMFRPRWSSPLPVILSFVLDEDFTNHHPTAKSLLYLCYVNTHLSVLMIGGPASPKCHLRTILTCVTHGILLHGKLTPVHGACLPSPAGAHKRRLS